jgi:hypothetical protein
MGKFREYLDKQKLKVDDEVTVSGDNSVGIQAYDGIVTGINNGYVTVKDNEGAEHEEEIRIIHKRI